MAHLFIWITLRVLKVPVGIIRAIQALYRRSVHYIRFGGATREAFTVCAGVKQGCPLSGLLFVIVCDSLLRSLCEATPRGGLIRAYADDIAIVLARLWEQAPSIALLFAEFALIARLELKPNNCVLLHFGPYELRSVRDLLRETVPMWANFCIDSYAKYLGLMVGPGAEGKS